MADLKAGLKWSGEKLQFTGSREGGPEIIVDGDAATGPSPMAVLLLSLAGCMGADILDIGLKMRLPITGLALGMEADRRPDPPRRFTAIRMTCSVTGVAETDRAKLQRAVDLSRDTYCSVMHSLREDIDVRIELELR